MFGFLRSFLFFVTTLCVGAGFSSPLYAADKTNLSEAKTSYSLSRFSSLENEALAWTLLGVVVVVAVLFVAKIYRRESNSLKPGRSVLLFALRIGALVALLIMYLGIERRDSQKVIRNSQVAILVDLSQSMGLQDVPVSGGEPLSRLGAVAKSFSQSGSFLESLSEKHNLNVLGFDESSQVIATSKKSPLRPTKESSPQEKKPRPFAKTNWKKSLLPRGSETQLGGAIYKQLTDKRDGPLSAVIVISDGGQNAGLETSTILELAKEKGIPVYTIGVGDTKKKKNLFLADLIAPARAFPGDKITITGYLRHQGYTGRLIEVQLLAKKILAGENENSRKPLVVDTQRVTLSKESESTVVRFQVTPADPVRMNYTLLLKAPPDDSNATDNKQTAEIEVVDQKTRVLLFAGGPSREYRFIRNQLKRDKSMQVDILLQTAQPGISQDADKILPAFPADKETLYEYDCIIAFDPNWKELAIEEVALLEQWVADEAGGLITIAGPIHATSWLQSTEHTKLRTLFPVIFQRRISLLDEGQYGSESAWPLQFERAGREAEFLRLEDDRETSLEIWDSFPGIYGYMQLKGAKPGATVYARYSDPNAGYSGKQPILLAGHFYGSGRVFYIGSGEFWRLRAIGTGYFERLYTQLIRYVSQGRLLRGSSHGALMVERDRYVLGESVILRARLLDKKHDPLIVRSVNLQVTLPTGRGEMIQLQADNSRPGMYIGQYRVRLQGGYRFDLPVPGSLESQLTRRIQVKVPNLEQQNPEQNVKLLKQLAEGTGGKYFPNLKTVSTNKDPLHNLIHLIPDRSEEKILRGAPDKKFTQHLMQSLLTLICVCLFSEWLIRRLSKLA